MAGDEFGGIKRVERGENADVILDMDDAQQRHDGKPDHHDRPEETGDAGGAAALHDEQQEQNRDGQQDDMPLIGKGGMDQLEPLHRGEDRNGRRDDGIAVEQGGTHDAEQENHRPRRPKACCASAMSDSVPPSPLLSARMIKSRISA